MSCIVTFNGMIAKPMDLSNCSTGDLAKLALIMRATTKQEQPIDDDICDDMFLDCPSCGRNWTYCQEHSSKSHDSYIYNQGPFGHDYQRCSNCYHIWRKRKFLPVSAFGARRKAKKEQEANKSSYFIWRMLLQITIYVCLAYLRWSTEDYELTLKECRG